MLRIIKNRYLNYKSLKVLKKRSHGMRESIILGLIAKFIHYVDAVYHKKTQTQHTRVDEQEVWHVSLF